ncbi:MAG: EI24 domain-containing protein [Thiovulaceae bacterium]|jgi:hypothetical protein|nr:EI24 domain-containing protein [Sulfurimonadaceae bacterium]
MQPLTLITQSIKDLLTPQMLKYAIIPFIATLILLYAVFFFLAGMGVEALGTLQVESQTSSVQNGVPHTESFSATLEGTQIMQFLMSYTLTSWIATFLIYALGGILTLYLSIFLTLIVIGFLTPLVLKELQKRHYNDVAMIGHSNPLEALWYLLKWAAVMVLLFFLFIPLYLIPFVNIVAFNFPLYYFFHKMLTYDVASSIAAKEEFREIKQTRANDFRLKTLGLYLLSLIPFAIFFSAIFFVIYLGHAYFLEVRRLREAAAH